MTNVTDFNRPAFAAAAQKLRLEGHTVFNPGAANQEGRSLSDIMAYVLVQLCECEAVALLPGWSMSPGAQIEYQLAKYINLKIIELDDVA